MTPSVIPCEANNITDNVSAGHIPAVYIHVPFCAKKCSYCDFISANYADKTSGYADRYLKVLAKEFFCHLPHAEYRFPLSVYVGGGTPSLLSEKQVSLLFENLFKYIRDRRDIKTAEITFEMNPESVTADKLKILKKFGVNRLSFGLQSFDDNLLKSLGRIHTKNDFLEAFKSARKAGFENINVDLIFGIPGQTLENWKTDVKSALNLNPEHISAYNLTVEEGTEFHKNGVIVDDDLSADMYGFVIERLKQKGYVHYEISNFAKAGFECRHNINYWHNGEYLGFGQGAVSYVDGVRIKNTDNLVEYLSGKFHVDFEKLNSERKISEDIMLGLRLTRGIEMSDSVKQKFFSQIDSLKNSGLLEESGNFLKLTDRGILFANRVFGEFL